MSTRVGAVQNQVICLKMKYKKTIGIRHLWEARRGMTWAGVVAARVVHLDPDCPCWPWHPGQCRDVVPVPVWQCCQPVPHWTSMTGELGWELEQGGCPSPLAQRGRLMSCRCWVLLPSYVLELHPELVSAHPSSCQPPAVVQHHPISSWGFPTASQGSACCLHPPELPLPMCCPQPAPLPARVGHCPLKHKAVGPWWQSVAGGSCALALSTAELQPCQLPAPREQGQQAHREGLLGQVPLSSYS